jgi:hypothetical protein
LDSGNFLRCRRRKLDSFFKKWQEVIYAEVDEGDALVDIPGFFFCEFVFVFQFVDNYLNSVRRANCSNPSDLGLLFQLVRYPLVWIIDLGFGQRREFPTIPYPGARS